MKRYCEDISLKDRMTIVDFTIVEEIGGMDKPKRWRRHLEIPVYREVRKALKNENGKRTGDYEIVKESAFLNGKFKGDWSNKAALSIVNTFYDKKGLALVKKANGIIYEIMHAHNALKLSLWDFAEVRKDLLTKILDFPGNDGLFDEVWDLYLSIIETLRRFGREPMDKEDDQPGTDIEPEASEKEVEEVTL